MRNNFFKEEISSDEIRSLPLSSFKGEIIVVDNPGAVESAIMLLEKYDILGFDTETKPAFKKGVINEVALLQLSAGDRAFIFRLNMTGLPASLINILANKKIIKVGVALRDDIKALQRLCWFNPAGFVELQELVGNYNISNIGLRKLAGIVLGIKISKSQQVSNWEREVLTDMQIMYAATDAWVCYEIYIKLINTRI